MCEFLPFYPFMGLYDIYLCLNELKKTLTVLTFYFRHKDAVTILTTFRRKYIIKNMLVC